VNRAWSLFVSWGGPRGHADSEMGFGSSGATCDCESPGDRGYGYGLGTIAPAIDVKAQIAPVVAACSPGAAHVELDIELTREEIVDVAVRGGPSALRACITEAVWNMQLTVPNAPDHVTTHVAL
jgi:hypothetical protein